jgi:hypothetical protein
MDEVDDCNALRARSPDACPNREPRSNDCAAGASEVKVNRRCGLEAHVVPPEVQAGSTRALSTLRRHEA